MQRVESKKKLAEQWPNCKCPKKDTVICKHLEALLPKIRGPKLTLCPDMDTVNNKVEVSDVDFESSWNKKLKKESKEKSMDLYKGIITMRALDGQTIEEAEANVRKRLTKAGLGKFESDLLIYRFLFNWSLEDIANCVGMKHRANVYHYIVKAVEKARKSGR